MSSLPVQQANFRVDTSRPRSRSKLRSKIRQVLGVFSVMFPAMSVFVFVMSLFYHELQRKNLHVLAMVFVGLGMLSLLFYAWARADKNRRHELSMRRRELRQKEQAEKLRLKREGQMRKSLPDESRGA
ncbi:MAG: hypothetical protein GX803_03625 [Lentisphaerae bacterium]|nr:hypothetical protein [Lentisphaerota bacterium]